MLKIALYKMYKNIFLLGVFWPHASYGHALVNFDRKYVYNWRS